MQKFISGGVSQTSFYSMPAFIRMMKILKFNIFKIAIFYFVAHATGFNGFDFYNAQLELLPRIACIKLSSTFGGQVLEKSSL